MSLNRPSTFLLAALAVCATTPAQAGEKVIINNTDHDLVVTVEGPKGSMKQRVSRDKDSDHNVWHAKYEGVECKAITFEVPSDDTSSRTDMGTGMAGGMPGMDALGASPNGVGGTAIHPLRMDRNFSNNILNQKMYFTVTLAAGDNGPSFKIDW